jgi:hypothetical protein
MTKTLKRAFAEVARLPEADQDRIARELLAEIERLHARSSIPSEGSGPLSAADLDWLAAHRVKRTASTDAGTLVSQMRDEDWR